LPDALPYGITKTKHTLLRDVWCLNYGWIAPIHCLRDSKRYIGLRTQQMTYLFDLCQSSLSVDPRSPGENADICHFILAHLRQFRFIKRSFKVFLCGNHYCYKSMISIEPMSKLDQWVHTILMIVDQAFSYKHNLDLLLFIVCFWLSE